MLRLHLLRHAKTEVSSPTGEDFDRELMVKGIIQANMSGLYFELNSIQAQSILCSAAKRTIQTLDIIRYAMPSADVIIDYDLYLADRETLLEKVWNQNIIEQTRVLSNEAYFTFLICVFIFGRFYI